MLDIYYFVVIFGSFYWWLLHTDHVESCPEDICIWISLAIQGESQVTYKLRCPLPMRQFPLWNKPITLSLDILKWQLKCLRHSLIMWIQLSGDINGFALYLHLPSGCFDLLKLWRLKWWYLHIISSEVKVRTPGQVPRQCQSVTA